MKIPRGVWPSIFTLGNGLAGFGAILAAARGNPTFAVACIALALVLDGLDGLVARALGVANDFGLHYDNVNDSVTFGAAGGVLGYFALLPIMGELAFVPAGIYFCAVAFRLARFGALAMKPKPAAEPEAKKTKERFFGLPSTGGAMLVMALVMCLPHARALFGISDTLLVTVVSGGMIAAGALMVSKVRYGALPHFLALPKLFHAFLVVLLVSCSIFFDWQIALFIAAGGYAASGPILSLFKQEETVTALEQTEIQPKSEN